MASHPLDNMVWNALAGPQAHLGTSNGKARRFDPDIAIFAAVEHPLDSLEALAEIIPSGARAGLVTTGPVIVPPEFEQVAQGEVVQLTAEKFVPVSTAGVIFRDLNKADVPQMVDLVALTRPGPFGPRTIEMGHYVGVFDGARLIAMAGERLRLAGFGEVSAVCTHPDYQGRGLAKALVSVIGSEIVARGEVPFLQAYTSNVAALATYTRLGFEPRRNLTFTTLQRR
ncbi:MAG TPA: GNAT family N-acetyltransferase [Devosia sp.]|nr:GNAT family N-acetyltransferase [Devosia sp.]